MLCRLVFIYFTECWLELQLDESNKGEQVQVQRCRARMDHLSMLQGENAKENEAEWNNTRVQRILVDYMLRSSYYDTALKLAEMKNIQVCLEFMPPFYWSLRCGFDLLRLPQIMAEVEAFRFI